MKLGFIDRVEKLTIHILPKHRQSNLFDKSETSAEYVTRFFQEIRGLGNVVIIKIQHSKQHRIGIRGL